MLRNPAPSPRRTALPVALLLLALACPAHAHAAHGEAAGFATGFGHPWSGWDHILAMIAVGLWGAQLRAPAVWVLPVAFPLVMAIGGFLGLIGAPLPGTEIGIALSAILLGGMVAFEARPPLWIAAVLVGIFGLFHGHAHGTELPEGQNGLLYSLGFVIATGCLHGVGIAIGLIHKWKGGRISLRGAGIAISLAGFWFAKEALA
ncbi:HupE/UreJ family protein [Luteolibacter sp. LG18]|uniref:HupE/UreJ family protein n=1 Tax=Luteolibacter sp. LG18 TaxID=2819286 RepID=UPI002B2B6E17|nr:urease accessory protein UreJ [Luteolibacter sp. LG18]